MNVIGKWFILFLSVTIAAEVIIRLSGIVNTYSERNGFPFETYYNQQLPSWYLTQLPHEIKTYANTEISYTDTFNSLGLRNVEISPVTDSCHRLFIIGDSFTEGSGTDRSHTMPYLLGKKIDSAHLSFETYNAGVSGSDPFFEYILLRDKLLAFHPSHVIIVINESDIYDQIFRGGFERFNRDGTVSFLKGPWWLPIYKFSFILRLAYGLMGNFNNYDTFMTKKELKEKKQIAIANIFECLKKVNQLCTDNHIRMLVITHPFPDSFNYNVNNNDIDGVIALSDSDSLHIISTFAVFSNYLNINTYRNLGWKRNGHFNSNGYQLFANIVFDEINSQYPAFWN